MKTKKMWGLFAMTTLLVGTGCSTDEVVNDISQGNAIQFGTYVGRNPQARATVITTDGSQTTDGLTTNPLTSFGVFAYYTGQTSFAGALAETDKASPNFMYNQAVYKNTDQTLEESAVSSGWNYSPVKYWPNNEGDKISFFAYAPYDADCAKGDNDANLFSAGLPNVKFTVADEVKDQIDFLYATPVTDKTKQTVEENVKFTFNHALSRIGFHVQTMIDKVNDDDVADSDTSNDEDDAVGEKQNGENLANETKVVVKMVKLSGKFINSGTLAWTEETGNDEGKYTAAITGTASTDNITYTLEAEQKANGATNFKDATKSHSVGAIKESQVTVYGQSVNQAEAQLNADDSYIMIIPQKFTDENQLTITVSYDVITADKNLSLGYSQVSNEISTSFSGVEFAAGKAYTFSLHLGLTSVKLEAEVTGWDTGKDWAVNVPLNIADNESQTGGTGGDGDTNP